MNENEETFRKKIRDKFINIAVECPCCHNLLQIHVKGWVEDADRVVINNLTMQKGFILIANEESEEEFVKDNLSGARKMFDGFLE